MAAHAQDHNKSLWFQKYVLSGIVGFLVISAVNAAALKLNQFYAGWIWSLPFSAAIVVIFLQLYPSPGTNNRAAIAGFVGNTIPGMILLLGWLVTMWLLLTYTKIGFWPAFGYAFLAWVLLSIPYFFGVCGSPIIKNLKYQNYCWNMGGAAKAT